MGRITIFTEDECENSQIVKDILINMDITFTEINLSSHRKRRRDMIDLCHCLETPQIFFNSDYVGNSVDFLALMISWEDETIYSAYDSVKERIVFEVLNGESPDERSLRLPKAKAGSDNSLNKINTKINELLLPDGTTSDVCSMTLLLMKHLPKSTSFHKTKLIHDCFSGKSLVQTLQKIGVAVTQEEAIEFSQTLQNLQVFHSVSKSQSFDLKSNCYRLQPHLDASVMNSFCFWVSYTGSGEILEEPLKILLDLRKLLDGVIGPQKYNDPEKTYGTTKMDVSLFTYFEQQVCKLQLIDVVTMDTRTRVAFFINLYNLMTCHGMKRLDVRKLSQKHLSSLKYNVGGFLLSLNDIEHGILRANYPYGEKDTIQFSSSDDRCRFILTGRDKRIHFALDRGVGTVVGSYQFTREAVELELQIVSEMYCAMDENVSINPNKNELVLPAFMKTHLRDFVKSFEKLPNAVSVYLQGEKLEMLEAMINYSESSKEEIKIKFHDPRSLDCYSSRNMHSATTTNATANEEVNEQLWNQSYGSKRNKSLKTSLKTAKSYSSKKMKRFLQMDRRSNVRNHSEYFNTQNTIFTVPESQRKESDNLNVVGQTQAHLYPDDTKDYISMQNMFYMESINRKKSDNETLNENEMHQADVLNCESMIQIDVKSTPSREILSKKSDTPSERTTTTEEESPNPTVRNILDSANHNNLLKVPSFDDCIGINNSVNLPEESVEGNLNLTLDICPTNSSEMTSRSGVSYGESSTGSSDIVSRLSSLVKLKNSGALTEEEFKAAKAIVISEGELSILDNRTNRKSPSNEITNQTNKCASDRAFDKSSEISYVSRDSTSSDRKNLLCVSPNKEQCETERAIYESENLISQISIGSATASEVCDGKNNNHTTNIVLEKPALVSCESQDLFDGTDQERLNSTEISQNASIHSEEKTCFEFDQFSMQDDDVTISRIVGDATNVVFDDLWNMEPGYEI